RRVGPGTPGRRGRPRSPAARARSTGKRRPRCRLGRGIGPLFDAYGIPRITTPQMEDVAGFGARAFRMVVLHTFFTDETVERAVRTVHTAAEQAGRDPGAVRIWSCYATVHDGLPEDLRLRKTVGRLATYLQRYGDLLVATNGWDPEVLARFRADQVVRSVPGAIDAKADEATLEHIATLLPE